jgi:hypothetical protein
MEINFRVTYSRIFRSARPKSLIMSSGSLPETLENLTNLRDLNLSKNDFSGMYLAYIQFYTLQHQTVNHVWHISPRSMNFDALLISLCLYTGIPPSPCVRVNLIYVTPQSLTKTELASRPYYQGVPFTYEVIDVSEAHKPAIQRCLRSTHAGEIPSRTHVVNEIVALIGRTACCSGKGPCRHLQHCCSRCFLYLPSMESHAFT